MNCVSVVSLYLSLASKPPYVPAILICTYSFSMFPLSPSLLLPSLSLLTNTLPFMQNLGLVCLQSITLILEDDFNKQVTLSRGGQILTSPNQGFTLNGKKQGCEYISVDSKRHPKGSFSLGWWHTIYWVLVSLHQKCWRPPYLLFFSSGLEFA